MPEIARVKWSLKRFNRVRWQGSEAFHKLYLDLLIDCCLRVIRSDKIHGGCG
jgi:hypothetical protein